MSQYFLRSNHRDRIDSVNYGKVCPGQLECPEAIHWMLVFFEILAPYIIGLSLLPLIVKARVQHAYAHLKKNEEEEEPEPKAKKTPEPVKQGKKGKKGHKVA